MVEKGLRLNSNDFIIAPNIRQLALRISKRPTATQAELASSALPASNETFGLSPIQHWLFEQNPDAIEGFCQYQTLQIASLDIEQLESTLTALLQHHDAFRLRFSRINSLQMRFYCDSQPTAKIEHHSFTGTAGDTGLIERTVQTWSQQFKPETGDLVRFGVFEGHKDGEHRVVIAIHHLIVDGVSWRLLLNNLKALYFGSALPSPSPPLHIVQSAIEQYANSKTTIAQLDYWRDVKQKSALLGPKTSGFSNSQRFQKSQQAHCKKFNFRSRFQAC